MDSMFVSTPFKRLDPGMKRCLRETITALETIRVELSTLSLTEPDAVCLHRWAMFYVVVLEDLAQTFAWLAVDGKHNRALILLRRTAFEYRTRFNYYWNHLDQAKLATDEFHSKIDSLAKRLKPVDDIQIVRDPAFDKMAHKKALKGNGGFQNFEVVCNSVHREQGQYAYGKFFNIPSALSHGDATAMGEVFSLRSDGGTAIHTNSMQPSPDPIADNTLVFLLDFAKDVCTAFGLKSLTSVDAIGATFMNVRRRLGIEIL